MVLQIDRNPDHTDKHEEKTRKGIFNNLLKELEEGVGTRARKNRLTVLETRSVSTRATSASSRTFAS